MGTRWEQDMLNRINSLTARVEKAQLNIKSLGEADQIRILGRLVNIQSGCLEIKQAICVESETEAEAVQDDQ